MHGLLIFPNFRGSDWYVFVFTAREFEGELLESSPEGKLEWIDDNQLTKLNLWESDSVFLPWIAAGKFFSAKFDYEGDVMQGYEVTFHS
jgi:8-oxo-dGTP diphosphatase